MPTFTQSVLIDSPVATVFAFHERDDALPLLTPPFPPMKVVSRTGGISVGARVELRIGFIPWFAFNWTALHTAFVQDRLFVDEQISGPFAKWIHRHEFADAAGKTLLTDSVQYELPGGALVNALLGWSVKPGLARMFAYRHRVTKQFCELHSSAKE